jgi:HK97 family phage major capsid protein
MPTLTEVREKLQAKSDELAKIFEEAGDNLDLSKVTSFDFPSKDDISRRTEIKKRNDELTELGKEKEALQAVQDAADNVKNLRKPVNRPSFEREGGDKPVPAKTLRQYLDESQEYKTFREHGGGTAVIEIAEKDLGDLGFKTTLTLSDINNPATRRAGIVPSAQEERTIRDLMLDGTTDNNAITYMEETTFTNNADTVAEGGVKPEGELDFTERTDNVRKIATWIPATAELLADVSGIESYIRGRLAFMVRRKEEQQLLLGDGVAPNILGVQVRTGVQTQAKGADPVPDAIYKGMNKVMNTGFADPTAVVFHPNDWMDIRLLRTADGVYIWGNPSEAGPERIWGLPIRQTTAQTENTAFVGAFRPMAQVFQREGIVITISTEHSDFFIRNKVAILAEERLALAVYRPAAFCKVTGI